MKLGAVEPAKVSWNSFVHGCGDRVHVVSCGLVDVSVGSGRRVNNQTGFFVFIVEWILKRRFPEKCSPCCRVKIGESCNCGRDCRKPIVEDDMELGFDLPCRRVQNNGNCVQRGSFRPSAMVLSRT